LQGKLNGEGKGRLSQEEIETDLVERDQVVKESWREKRIATLEESKLRRKAKKIGGRPGGTKHQSRKTTKLKATAKPLGAR